MNKNQISALIDELEKLNESGHEIAEIQTVRDTEEIVIQIFATEVSMRTVRIALSPYLERTVYTYNSNGEREYHAKI